jgi:hypothetical protein
MIIAMIVIIAIATSLSMITIFMITIIDIHHDMLIVMIMTTITKIKGCQKL